MIKLPENLRPVYSGSNGNPRLEIGKGRDLWTESVLAVRTYDFLEESETTELQAAIDQSNQVSNLPRVQRTMNNSILPGTKSRKFLQ
jgi:hypothetical protein